MYKVQMEQERRTIQTVRDNTSSFQQISLPKEKEEKLDFSVIRKDLKHFKKHMEDSELKDMIGSIKHKKPSNAMKIEQSCKLDTQDGLANLQQLTSMLKCPLISQKMPELT